MLLQVSKGTPIRRHANSRGELFFFDHSQEPAVSPGEYWNSWGRAEYATIGLIETDSGGATPGWRDDSAEIEIGLAARRLRPF